MTEEKKPAEIVKLSGEADAYFRSLEGLTYPQVLVDQYPRIANQLAELKDSKTKLQEYFQSLTNDQRGSRAGFPFGVLMNLQDLRDAMLDPTDPFAFNEATKWVS